MGNCKLDHDRRCIYEPNPGLCQDRPSPHQESCHDQRGESFEMLVDLHVSQIPACRGQMNHRDRSDVALLMDDACIPLQSVDSAEDKILRQASRHMDCRFDIDRFPSRL